MLYIARRLRQHQRPRCPAPPTGQKGVALLILLVILVVGTTSLLLNSLSRASINTERDRITAEALAQAREALIAYAVGAQLPTATSSSGTTTKRPGDLPCPDRTNDGSADTPCDMQADRIGRLPWKTLGLPDLRDGHGERLWYAISINFKNSARTTCNFTDRSGCLNSDTRGTITVRNSSGVVINDGSNPDAFTPSGVIAVVISPGAVLKRQGATALQDRSALGESNPENYLDIGNGEDNAAFTDSSSTDGFINGPILDAEGNAIVNDRLITITYQDLMPKLEKRVAGEVLKCLVDYASANRGRYPWAADIGNSGNGDYVDISGHFFGRIPDTPFVPTSSDSGGGMSSLWSTSCNIFSTSGWWLNWKEQVFYGLANAYKPTNPPLSPATNACDTSGACLVVNPPSATANKQVVVIVAGKRLSGVASGQPRASAGDKGNVTNYLESPNQGGAAFSQGSPTSIFNDAAVYR